MTESANPALETFLRFIAPERIWCEVLIQSTGSEFTLRHAADRNTPNNLLKRITIPEVRNLAMFNAVGQFRPLRSSPDLARGWVLSCPSANDLWRALQELYPGSIPDWFAAQSGASPTNYREFTNRQTGMYRISSMLSDAQAAQVTRAACHPRFCLKQRLWTVPGLAPDSAATKSYIACLEPCAVLLELARKATRIEQEDKLSVQLSRSELESFLAATEMVLSTALAAERVGNIASPVNPRRLQLLLEKFKEEAGENSKPNHES